MNEIVASQIQSELFFQRQALGLKTSEQLYSHSSPAGIIIGNATATAHADKRHEDSTATAHLDLL
jgi:hypothetical protein